MLMVFSIYGNAKKFDRKVFEQTLKTIKEKSYYELSDDEIYKAALAGVLKHLEGKNRQGIVQNGFERDANILLPPREVHEMDNEVKGEVSGIGVAIQYDKKKGQVYPKLITVIEGGGAQDAGLAVGDQILKIDGIPVNKFKSFKEIVYRIRGKSGSKVSLSILRNGEALKKQVSRKKIHWAAVDLKERQKHYSHIKINFFNKKTVFALEKELKHMVKRGARSLILDLRENSGGLFEEGLKAIKLFAKKGDTVLIAKYNQDKNDIFKASKKGIATQFKVVVLVGGETKSMGEAFSLSLKKLAGATIIGERTFGKGTMETVLNLKNKHSVKFTIGRLFTSDDQTWDKVGVFPDVEVPREKDHKENDRQVNLAKLLIKGKS
jgi:carboxyl-terminal processing protease